MAPVDRAVDADETCPDGRVGWRMVNSGAGRVGGGCPSGAASVARISGRCTGPSSKFPSRRDDSSGSMSASGTVVVRLQGGRRAPESAPPAAHSGCRRSMRVSTGWVAVQVRARLVRDAFRAAGQHLRIERGGRLRFAALARNLRVLVLVFGVAGGAARLLHIWLRPSRRRRGWSRAARADSNRPECHQAEAGAAASISPEGTSLAGKYGERRCNTSRAGFEVAITINRSARPSGPASRRRRPGRRPRRSARSTAASASPPPTPRGVTRSTMSASKRSLASRHSAAVKRLEIAALGDQLAHQRPDDLVRAPERHAASHQIVGDIGGEQQA